MIILIKIILCLILVDWLFSEYEPVFWKMKLVLVIAMIWVLVFGVTMTS